MHNPTETTAGDVYIGPYPFDEYVEMAGRFHGYAAPGLILGGFMVEEAKRHLPEDILFDAVAESSWCVPDAIQMLTPCTVGNGWLKIINLGLYALSLYDKYTGKGVRVAVNPATLSPYPVIAEWLLKLKPKQEQDSERLRQEMKRAGHSICDVQDITMRGEFLKKRSKGAIAVCKACGQAYPARDGASCRACQGEAPYAEFLGARQAQKEREERLVEGPRLKAMPTEQAVGGALLHDMTCIEPGKSKGAVFQRKQVLNVGDVCQLHRMGRFTVYIEDGQDVGEGWVHEDEAAEAMSDALAGEGVRIKSAIREGKATLQAAHDGVFVVKTGALKQFNSIPGVACAARQSYSVVKSGQDLAGARAIPLYLERSRLEQALGALEGAPPLRVEKIRPRTVGVLVTGTEIFKGLVEDRFAPIIQGKVENYGCPVLSTKIVPDDREAIASTVAEMLGQGVELVVTTAGLSVDPEDVTRKGLLDAGAYDMLYGAPVLPGAMTLLARIGQARIMGVPACALYFKTTSFDLLLPRVLADLPLTRGDLAELGHGGFCRNCKICTYPKCAFGK